MSRPGPLVVVPSLPVYRAADGRVAVTRKFTDGMARYGELWGGEVVAIMHPLPGTDSVNLDSDFVALDSLPFRLIPEEFTSDGFYSFVAGAAVLVGGPHHLLPGLARRCRELGVPAVYNTEYSLRTRIQIARADRLPALRLARRVAWEIEREARIRLELRSAAGLQCNGTPTYEALQHIVPRALLYFDSRITDDQFVEPEAHRRAQARRANSQPLRLAFSGRFTPMKGVDHLAAIADELRRVGCDFELHLCGGGELHDAVQADIARRGLGERVIFHGVLDFRTELIPLLVDSVDLFVCPHVQGDPSCTYLETLACGVPIVGYDNEALAGLIRHAPGVGWTTPLRRPALLASAIAALDRDRARLVAAADAGLEFAHEHDFGRTFRRRMEHLRVCADEARPLAR